MGATGLWYPVRTALSAANAAACGTASKADGRMVLTVGDEASEWGTLIDITGEVQIGGPRFWYLRSARQTGHGMTGPGGNPVGTPGTRAEYRFESDLALAGYLRPVGPDTRLSWARMVFGNGARWLNDLNAFRASDCEDILSVTARMEGYRGYEEVTFHTPSAISDMGLYVDATLSLPVGLDEIEGILRPLAMFMKWSAGCAGMPHSVLAGQDLESRDMGAVPAYSEKAFRIHSWLLSAELEAATQSGRRAMPSPTMWANSDLAAVLRAWLDNGYALSEAAAALNPDVLRADPIDEWTLKHWTRNALVAMEFLSSEGESGFEPLVSDEARKALLSYLDAAPDSDCFATVPDEPGAIGEFIHKVKSGLGNSQDGGYARRMSCLVEPIGDYLGLGDTYRPEVATRLFRDTRNWLSHGGYAPKKGGKECRDNLVLTYVLAQAAIECWILRTLGLWRPPVGDEALMGKMGGYQQELAFLAMALKDEFMTL